jgi:aminoglycoside phosphotransferase
MHLLARRDVRGGSTRDDLRCEDVQVNEVQVVVAHSERATLRVGDTFLKVDGDQDRLEREARVMALAPIPTPEILWRRPSVLALAALPGIALGRLGEASTASSRAWSAAGAAARRLHESAPPPWPGRGPEGSASEVEEECAWLVAHDVVPAAVVDRNRRVAEAVFRPYTPVFTHGDLQLTHVFVDGDEVTGVLDWSEAGQGDPLFDLAILTLGHEERLDQTLAGYGKDVDVDVIRAWWSLRSLTAIRWLIQHGFDPAAPGGEIDVLLAQM